MTKHFYLINNNGSGWYYKLYPMTTEKETNVEKCLKTVTHELVQTMVPDLNTFTVV